MLAQAEKVHAVSRRRKAKSSTKRSRRKGLPPTKRFNFTMVDDDFEESQRCFAPKETNADTKKCVKFFKDSAITAAQPLKWCRMIFSALTPRCKSSKSASAMVLSNRLAGGRLLPLPRVHMEDLAILRRLKARYQLQVCNHNQRIQRFKLPAHFEDSIFGKPITARFQWRIAYFTARVPRARSARGPRAVSAIRH